jgi:hypothetical protein
VGNSTATNATSATDHPRRREDIDHLVTIGLLGA